MGYAACRRIGGPDGLLARTEPFEGNTMWARWTTTDAPFRMLRHYEVYSYSTQIAEYDRATGGLRVADGHWSVTTTRHQNLCRAWLPCKAIYPFI